MNPKVNSQRESQRRVPPLTPARRVKFAFLGAGFVSLLLSVSLWFTGNHEAGLFVGLWVPAIHSLGTLVLTPEG